MQAFRRVLSLVLAISMTISMMVTASAQEEGKAADALSPSFAEKHDALKTLKSEIASNAANRAETNRHIIYNDYLEYVIHQQQGGSVNDGRFTMGNREGNPDYSSDNNKILLFGHPSPWSSYTTINLDGQPVVFQSESTVSDGNNLIATSKMNLDGVEVRQVLTLVANPVTGIEDTLQIKYILTNNSQNTHETGVRIMLDTMLGSNDGAPFKVPGHGNVTQELELRGGQIPQYWQCFNNLDNPEVISVGTLFKDGERKPDKVQFTNWGGIYSSENAWDYTVSANQTVTNDSAVGVYWNPVRLNPGQSAEFTTYYGVGFTNDGGSSVLEDDMEIDSESFGVLVIDHITGRPVTGASVRIEGFGTETVNTEGVAIFRDPPERSSAITVSADGYFAVGVSRNVRKGQFTTVILTKVGSPNVSSLIIDNQNLTYRTVSFEKPGQSKQAVIRATWGSYTPGVYQLVQNDVVKVESSSDTFTLNPAADFSTNGAVILRMIDSSGLKVYEGRVGIRSVYPVGFAGNKLNIGGANNVTAPSGVPIFENTEFELGFGPVEVEVEIDGNKVKVAVNRELVGKDFDTFKQDYEDVITGRSDAARAFGGTPEGFKSLNGDFEVKIGGYGEGTFNERGLATVNVGVVASVKGKLGYTQQFFIGWFPFFIEGNLEAGAKGKFEFNVGYDGGEFDMSNVRITRGEIVPEIKVSAGVGAGISGVASVKVSGGGKFIYEMKFTDNQKQAFLQAFLAVEAKAFMFKAKKEFPSRKYPVTDTSAIYGGGSGGGFRRENPFYDSSALESDFDLFNPGNYSLIQANLSASGYSVSSGTKVQAVNVGADTYLFWLALDPVRADENQSTLVYSKNGFSNPTAVYDDNTADFNFDVESNGGDIYIVWENLNTVHSGDIDLNSAANSSEITVAKLDTTASTVIPLGNALQSPLPLGYSESGEDATATGKKASEALTLGVSGRAAPQPMANIFESITTNTNPDVLPVVTVSGNGDVVISWIEFAQDDPFGITGGNIIHTYEYDGTNFTNVSSESESLPILSLDVGLLNGAVSVAAVLDQDGDLNTMEGDRIVSLNGQVVSGTGTASNAQFTSIDGRDALVWYQDRNFYYTFDGNSHSSIFPEPTDLIGEGFKVLSDEIIIWPAAGTEEGESAVYASRYENGEWTPPYMISVENGGVSQVSGFMNGSNIHYYYSLEQGDNASLISGTFNSRFGIELTNLHYNERLAGPGQELTLMMELENVGSQSISSVDVTIEGPGGQLVLQETLPCDLPIGSASTLDMGMIYPNIASESDFVLTISPTGESNAAGNNQQIFILGTVDLTIDVMDFLDNGRSLANISVSNLSAVSANAVLRIHADAPDGPVLFESHIQGLTRGINRAYICDLEALTSGIMTTRLYAVVSSSSESGDRLQDNAELIPYQPSQAITTGTYTIAVSAGTGGSVSGGGEYSYNDTATVTASPDNGYTFAGWYENNVRIEGASANYTLLVTENRVLQARFAFIGTNDESSASSDSDNSGGSEILGETSSANITRWVDKSRMESLAKNARDKGLSYVRTSGIGSYGIRVSAKTALTGLSYHHDTVDGNAVQVRVSIPDPSAIQKDLLLSGYVKGTAVNNLKAKFEKWFSNKLQVIQMEQQEPWGQSVTIAARLNFTDVNHSNLEIYAYDKKGNTYKRIANPNYRIDTNGYLHFTTDLAGSYIISEGHLVKK